MDCATAGAGLTIGPCCETDLNAEVSLGRIWPLPYTAFAVGALRGCASVLKTSTQTSAPAPEADNRAAHIHRD